jgi:hypothetical protein
LHNQSTTQLLTTQLMPPRCSTWQVCCLACKSEIKPSDCMAVIQFCPGGGTSESKSAATDMVQYILVVCMCAAWPVRLLTRSSAHCWLPAGVCTYTNMANGTSCSDGNLCTVSDTCQAGVCAGSPKLCFTTNGCERIACDPTTGAHHWPKLPQLPPYSASSRASPCILVHRPSPSPPPTQPLPSKR